MNLGRKQSSNNAYYFVPYRYYFFHLTHIVMFKRFFGKSKSNSQSEAPEQTKEEQREDADLKATEAMMKIRETMDSLKKK